MRIVKTQRKKRKKNIKPHFCELAIVPAPKLHSFLGVQNEVKMRLKMGRKHRIPEKPNKVPHTTFFSIFEKRRLEMLFLLKC